MNTAGRDLQPGKSTDGRGLVIDRGAMGTAARDGTYHLYGARVRNRHIRNVQRGNETYLLAKDRRGKISTVAHVVGGKEDKTYTLFKQHTAHQPRTRRRGGTTYILYPRWEIVRSAADVDR